MRPLDMLNDEQLTRLTRSNTRKNLGRRKSRFRSQMERVCRRLDNLTGELRQHRLPMHALPVVSPAVGRAPRSRLADAKIETAAPEALIGGWEGVGPELEQRLSSEDAFAIEPATAHGELFEGGSERESVLEMMETPKSVRISTSVTILDYEEAAVDQPISVSTLQRLEHPTRQDRALVNRRAIGQEAAFSKARIDMDPVREKVAGEEGKGGERGTGEAREAAAGERSASTARRMTPTAAFACPTPGGPYGPRAVSK